VTEDEDEDEDEDKEATGGAFSWGRLILWRASTRLRTAISWSCILAEAAAEVGKSWPFWTSTSPSQTKTTTVSIFPRAMMATILLQRLEIYRGHDAVQAQLGE